MSATAGPANRSTLTALTANLDIGDVADPALRLAYFQYMTDLSDANFAYAAGLVNTDKFSQLGFINVKDSAFGAIGDGVTDDTAAIRAAVATSLAGNGLTIFIPNGTYIISDTLYFTGDIPVTYVFPHKASLSIIGLGNPILRFTKTSGTFVSCGNSATATPMQYRLVLENIELDCNQHEVKCVELVDIGGYQPQLEMTRVRIVGIQGANSIGVDCTGGSAYLKKCLIEGYGTGGGKGIVPRVTAVNCEDVFLSYFQHGIYFTNFAETTIHFKNGLIQVCDNYLTWEGGGYIANNSTFDGTFIGECRDGRKLTNAVDITTFGSIGVVTFVGCQFDNFDPVTTNPMLDFNFGNLNGEVNLIGCSVWTPSLVKSIQVGQYINANLIGSRDITTTGNTYPDNINSFYRNQSNKVNATSGFKMTHYFTKMAMAAAANQILDGPITGLTTFIAPKAGVITGIAAQYSAAITAGNLQFSVLKNGVEHSFNTSPTPQLDSGVSKIAQTVAGDSVFSTDTNMQVAAGDLIEIKVYQNGFTGVGGNLLVGLSVGY